MSTILDTFRKSFDLESAVTELTDVPTFNGNPKRDLSVNEWLEKIKAVCVARKIPEEHWVKVAHHFMGPDAKTRLNELREVIAKVHGSQYRWTWQKFKVAMENMGWDIDRYKKETIGFSKTGSWWRMRKREGTKEEPTLKTKVSRLSPPLRRSSSFWNSKKVSRSEIAPPLPQHSSAKNSKEKSFDTAFSTPTSKSAAGSTGVRQPSPRRKPSSRSDTVDPSATRLRKPPIRSKTEIWTTRKVEEPEDHFSQDVFQSRAPSKSDTASHESATKPGLRRRNTETGTATVTQAPAWLLNACSALESITSDYPQAMSIISAILITAGAIPSLPAITAGAGGALLASHTAQAIGAVAVGIGQALSSQAKVQQGKSKEGGPKQVEGSASK